MYRINKIGPRTLPWGTPLRTSFHEDDSPFIDTYCLRPVKKFLIQNYNKHLKLFHQGAAVVSCSKHISSMTNISYHISHKSMFDVILLIKFIIIFFLFLFFIFLFFFCITVF